ncbi:MAG: hypothetical protein AB9869_23110 [Verrucomicrobiia bacterium]
MKTNTKITFADGGTAIVAFSLRDPARIGIVIKAWALLWQRDVMRWERTSDPKAEYWYDGRRKRMCRFDDPICCDLLEMLIPLSVAIEHRKKAIEEMQRQGRRASEIAEQLKMPLPTVDKMLND